MFDIDKNIKNEWRELGFYYDNGEEKDEWRFYGCKKGLQNFVRLLDEYIKKPNHAELSQEDAFGPYTYLKIMTWDKPTITSNYFAGTLENLANLKNLIADNISKTAIGQSFNIENDYGVNNSVTATFFIMPDDFDPVSMDKNYYC
ncbi:MAG: hypothetical protein M3R72_09855 [Bacteroidota bacterium]|nr:hypothetical protein [Bacteroidota bacterium]